MLQIALLNRAPFGKLKLPVRRRWTGNLRNVRKISHFVVVRSLTPQSAFGELGVRSLAHFQQGERIPRSPPAADRELQFKIELQSKVFFWVSVTTMNPRIIFIR
jgi:hypothetical protein